MEHYRSPINVGIAGYVAGTGEVSCDWLICYLRAWAFLLGGLGLCQINYFRNASIYTCNTFDEDNMINIMILFLDILYVCIFVLFF